MTRLPSISYLNLPQSFIQDKDDFYKSGIKEATKIRNLITTAQRIFIVSSKGVNLYLLGEKDVYCVEIFDNKSLICKLYYLPKEHRLDLYDGSDPYSPMFVWKSKGCIYKNIPISLEKVRVESHFLPLLGNI